MKKIVLPFALKASTGLHVANNGGGNVVPFSPRKTSSNAFQPLSEKEQKARKALIIKCKIAQRELGIDDVLYREMLQTYFGVTSSKELDEADLRRLLSAYNTTKMQEQLERKVAKHDKPICMKDKNNPLTPSLRRIEALLAEIGNVRRKYMPWSYALGILKKNTGVDAFENASIRDLKGVMVALEKTLQCEMKKQA